MTRKEKDARKYLERLIRMVELSLGKIDMIMQQPSTYARGKNIAAVCNDLEIEKDLGKKFGLGLPLSKWKARK